MSVRFSDHPSPWILALLITASLCSSCRDRPDDPTPTEPGAIEGTYVGIANLGGGTTNVLIEFDGPDSTGLIIGGIRYRGAITEFESVTSDSGGDTLRFRYVRDNTTYRAWAQVGASGLAVQFEQPADIPLFHVNREVGGYNLSGLWNGVMYSAMVEDVRVASMSMDQAGQIFYGTVDVYLAESAQLQISSGVSEATSFQISGTLRMASSNAPALLWGNYVTRDSIQGAWQAGDNAEVDHGEFAFGRPFD